MMIRYYHRISLKVNIKFIICQKKISIKNSRGFKKYNKNYTPIRKLKNTIHKLIIFIKKEFKFKPTKIL